MEPSSSTTQRGHVSWWRLLLTVSLLSIWISATTAKITVEVKPPNPIEGTDVLLLVHNWPRSVSTHLWLFGEKSHIIITYAGFRRKSYPGIAYSGREFAFHNGSMLIQNVTRRDTGNYTIHAIKKYFQIEEVTTELRVHYGPGIPTISPSDSHFHSGAALNLSCHADSDPPAQYSWLINGRPLQSTQELFIPHLAVTDSGSYTCHVHNSATGLNRTANRIITVLAPVAKPSIQASKTNVTENDTVVLTCVTKDSGISIQWFFNGKRLHFKERMTLSFDNSTLIIQPVRREDDGHYQCKISNPARSRRSNHLKLNVKE